MGERSPSSRLLTVQEAAAELGLPYTTTRDLILRGVLPRVEIPSLRRLYVDRREFERRLEIWKMRPVGASATITPPPNQARRRS